MQIIEHAQPIDSQSIEDILEEARQQNLPTDHYYAYLCGALQAAYKGLQLKVEIWHNNSIEEA